MDSQSLNLLATWAQNPQNYKVLEQSMFYLFAVLAIPLAYGVIFDRNIIRSGFLLIGVFGIISGLFLLLEAQFLALAQIMIYGVGITLVVVIALMLTNPKMERDMSPALRMHQGPAAAVSVLVFVCIYLAVRSAENWPIKGQPVVGAAEGIERLGQFLMTNYSLPFEFASILLLAALIGAVMLAKAEPVGSDSASGDSGEETKLNASGRADDVVKV